MNKLVALCLFVLAAAAAAMPHFRPAHLVGYDPSIHGPTHLAPGLFHPLQRQRPSAPAAAAAAAGVGAVSLPSLPGMSIALPSWYLVLHEWTWTRYVTWSFTGHPHTTGLTWGLQCKGDGCQTKTGFVGFRDADGTGFLRKTGVEAVGSTENSHQYGKVFCPEGKFMTSMNCKDLACTSMELVCAPLKVGLRAVYGDRWGGVWDPVDYQRVYCKQGAYIDGIECVESCTKSFNIFCSKVEALGSH